MKFDICENCRVPDTGKNGIYGKEVRETLCLYCRGIKSNYEPLEKKRMEARNEIK